MSQHENKLLNISNFLSFNLGDNTSSMTEVTSSLFVCSVTSATLLQYAPQGNIESHNIINEQLQTKPACKTTHLPTVLHKNAQSLRRLDILRDFARCKHHISPPYEGHGYCVSVVIEQLIATIIFYVAFYTC